MKKKLILAVVLLTIASTAYSWVWLAQGARWAFTAVNQSRIAFASSQGYKAATAKSLTVHSLVGGAMLASVATINNPPPANQKIPAHIKIDLSDLPKRDNPDPSRFEYDSSGRDVLPKGTYDPYQSLPVLPSNWGDVASEMGAPAFRMYRNSTNTTLRSIYTVDMQVGYKPGAVGTGTGSIPGTLPDDPQYIRVANIRQPSDSCGGASEDSPNCVYRVVYSKSESKSCADGYQLRNKLCELVESETVMKPEKTVPCEIINSNNGLEVDWRNPECNNLLAQNVFQNIDQNTVRLNTQDEQLTTSCNGSGCEMVYVDKTDNSWIKYTTGPSNSNGERPITSIDNGTGTAPTPQPPGSGQPGGGDTGGGDTGGGSGSLCLPGQPCDVRVDDSGFKDKETGLESLNDEEQAHFDNMMAKAEAVRFDETHGLAWDWVPELPDATCSPVRYGIDQHFIELDLCDKFQIVRDVLAWILYIYTAMYVLNLFLASAYPSYHTSKMNSRR